MAFDNYYRFDGTVSTILPLFGFSCYHGTEHETESKLVGGDYEIKRTGNDSYSVKKRPLSVETHYTGKKSEYTEFKRYSTPLGKELELEEKFQAKMEKKKMKVKDTHCVYKSVEEYHKNEAESKLSALLSYFVGMGCLIWIILTIVVGELASSFDPVGTTVIVGGLIWFIFLGISQAIGNRMDKKLRAIPFNKTSKKYQKKLKARYKRSIDSYGPEMAAIIREYIQLTK